MASEQIGIPTGLPGEPDNRPTLSMGSPTLIARVLFGLVFLGIMIAPVVAGVGGLSTYAFFILAIPVIVYAAFTSPGPHFLFDTIGKALLGVFVVQVLLAAISAQDPKDIVFGLNFLPLLFYSPVAAILSRVRVKEPVSLFAHAALVSALFSLLAAAIYVYGFGYGRAGAPQVNPNGLAGVAFNSGFFALLGLKSASERVNYYFLLGPIAALATITLTQSRLLILAYIPMVAIALFFLPNRRWRTVFIVGSVLGICVIAVAAVSIFGGGRWQFIRSASTVVAGGEVGFDSDSSISIRIALYSGGIQAFLQEPFFGHGWARIMEAVLPFIPTEEHRAFFKLASLHNDFIDFAVTGGVIGILTYLAIIITPVFAAIYSPKDRFYQARLMGVALLVASYFMRGLTDLMFGFETNTLYFVLFLAVFMGLFRNDEPNSGIQR